MDDAGFWSLIALLGQDLEDDDPDLDIEPVVRALAAMPREEIASFAELLARKLYALDGAAWAKEHDEDAWWMTHHKGGPFGEEYYLSVDGFLYARCGVVAQGRQFYEHVLANPVAMPGDADFEDLLGIAYQAAERQSGVEEFFDTSVSYETYSNATAWQDPRHLSVDAEQLSTSGEPATAVLTGITEVPTPPAGNLPSPTASWCDLSLEVTRSDGRTYRAGTRLEFRDAQRRAAITAPGIVLPVRIDPTDQARVAVDIEALNAQHPES